MFYKLEYKSELVITSTTFHGYPTKRKEENNGSNLRLSSNVAIIIQIIKLSEQLNFVITIPKWSKRLCGKMC